MNIKRLTICVVAISSLAGCVVEPAPRPVQVISTSPPAPEIDKPLPSTPDMKPAPTVTPTPNTPSALPDPP